MGNPYSDMVSEREEPLYFIEIGGSYACQICDEIVTKARYFPQESTADWKCSLGHKSEIEGFNIF